MIFKTDIAAFFSYLPPEFPGWKKWVYLYLSPGMEAVLNYRIGHWIWTKRGWRLALLPLYLFARFRVMKKWGIEIAPQAAIGPGFTIQHFGAIFIAGKVTIGSHCRIRQDVTVGHGGTGANEGYPVLGDHVTIHPGARVFGKITVGHRATIGANAVVYDDIPDGAVVACSPGYQILKINP